MKIYIDFDNREILGICKALDFQKGRVKAELKKIIEKEELK